MTKLSPFQKFLLWMLSSVMKLQNSTLKGFRRETNESLYGQAIIEYTDKNEVKRVEGRSLNKDEKQKAGNAENINVIQSAVFSYEYGQPSKPEIEKLKGEYNDDIKSAKTLRGVFVNTYRAGFAAIIFYLVTSLGENESFNLLTFVLVSLGGIFISWTADWGINSQRKRSYSAYLHLLYIENIYSHLTNQKTTLRSDLRYDEDNLQKELSSVTYINKLIILVGTIAILVILGLGVYKHFNPIEVIEKPKEIIEHIHYWFY